MKPRLACFLLLLSRAALPAQTPAAPPQASAPQPTAPPVNSPAPTQANVPYGPDPRQVLDFWQADTAAPAPFLLFIHGGSWINGDKNAIYNNGLLTYLKAGISVAAIHYRLVPAAQAAGIKPPVQWPLHDAARALQFVRHQASAWHLDKTRAAASGGSAGACSSLWLALHPDLADPTSTDLIARESTRLSCAAVSGAQTSLDPKQMQEWIPNSTYGGHAFGFESVPAVPNGQFLAFLKGRESVLPAILEYSPYEHADRGDPPIYLAYGSAPSLGQPQKDPTHSANFGVKLQEKLQAAAVPCQLHYPGSPGETAPTMAAFVIAALNPKTHP